MRLPCDLPQGDRIREAVDPALRPFPWPREGSADGSRRVPPPTMPDYAGLGRTIPDYPGLGRTIPDYPGQERAENTPTNRAPIRGETLQAVENTGLAETPRTRAHRPDRSRAAISRSCRAPSAASANDAGSRAARKPDHGPRDNFRPAAGRGRPRAWRGWGFRAGGAARARAPGVPPEKISRDNFVAPAALRHRCRRAGRARPPFSLLPPSGGEVGRGVAPGAGPPGRGYSRSRSSVNCVGAPASRRPSGPKARILVRASRDAGAPRGGTPLPTSPLKGGRREEGGGPPPARRQ